MVTISPVLDGVSRSEPSASHEDVLGALFDECRPTAFNLAYRLLRRQEDAADAVQDAYVLAVQAMRRETAAPRESHHLRPWLLKIVSNVALGKLRRHPGSLASLDALPFEPPDGDAEQPVASAVRREQRGDVLRALLALQDAQRAALTLREYQGLSYDDIGELLGLDRAATAALLYRARASFREAYEGLNDGAARLGCPELAPLISAMLDDELETGSWGHVERHVAGCRRCQDELRQLRRARRLYRTIPLLAPPAGWSLASTLEAAGSVGTVGAAGLVLTTASLAPPVATPALAVTTLAMTAPASVGIWGSLAALVTGKVAGPALAIGLGLATVLGSTSGDGIKAYTPGTEEAGVIGAASDLPAPPSPLASFDLDPERTRSVAAELASSGDAPPPNAPAPAVATTSAALVGPPLVPADAADRVTSGVSAARRPHADSPQSEPPLPTGGEAHDADHDLLPVSASTTEAAPAEPPPAITQQAVAVEQATAPGLTPEPAPNVPPPPKPRAGQSPPPPLKLAPPRPQPPTVQVAAVETPGVDLGPVEPPTTDVAVPALPQAGVAPADAASDALSTAQLPTVDVPPVQPPTVQAPEIPVPHVDPPQAGAPPLAVPDPAVPAIDVPQPDTANRVSSTVNTLTTVAAQGQQSASDPPRIDPPKVDPPSVQAPKVDPPKVDPSKSKPEKVDPPQVQAPKVDPPMVDPPKPQAPIVNPPKVDPPRVQTPKVDPPKADPPKPQAPKVDPPKADPPKVSPPKPDPPKVQAPKLDPPKVNPPKTQAPRVDLPKVGR